MGAVIAKGARILSSASNGPHLGQHAELRAIKACGSDTNGASLLVVRGSGRVSKPCRRCLRAIRNAGIKEVWFFDQTGTLGREDVAMAQEKDYKEKPNLPWKHVGW